MSFRLNAITADNILEFLMPEESILSRKAMALANEMDPEELCHFIKIINGFIENGVSAEELPSGVSIEELLDVRNVICKIIIDKISNLTLQESSNIEDFRGELEKCLSFRSKQAKTKKDQSSEQLNLKISWEKIASLLN